MMGQTHGLMILPKERSLFPKLVKPMFRYGLNYNELPGFVWMYQVDAMVCPHYDEEVGCKIYEKRPITCRGFPFEPKGKGLAIHESCPEIKRLVRGGGYTAPRISPPKSYMAAIYKIMRYYQDWLRTYKMERFDVELGKWRNMIDGLTEQHKKDMGWK